ncbi:MAG: type II secretion system protein [Proteobacteria bacterium]|nr:type II secretion system protein [Pseudomonadota bacterium]
MKTKISDRGCRGITLLEVAMVVAFLGVVAMVLLPFLARPRHHGSARIKCANNLKQIGLAYKVFANDNDDKFPFQVSTNTLAYGNITQTWMHFQAMSNECGSARILMCPSDRERLNNICSDFKEGTAATALSLSSKGNAAVSFGASLDGDETLPETILATDRNLKTNQWNLDGRLYLAISGAAPAFWTTNLHNSAGNYALSDGSVQQATSATLASQIHRQGITTNRLLLPFLP